MATSAPVGIMDDAPPRREKRVHRRWNNVHSATYAGMERELKVFLSRIRDDARAGKNQLFLPGFEKLTMKKR